MRDLQQKPPGGQVPGDDRRGRKEEEVLQRESLGLRPQLRELVDKTKQLKQSVEGAISRCMTTGPCTS